MTILADRQPIASGATTQPTPPPELPEVDDAKQFYLFGSYSGVARLSGIHAEFGHPGWARPPATGATCYVERGSGGLAWVLREIVKELTRLMELPSRWDGRQAQPIKPETVFAGVAVLANLVDYTSELPQFFPLPGGGIQVEWLSGTHEVEIQIDQSGEAWVLATTADGDEIAEGILNPQGPSDLDATVAGLVKIISAEIAAERHRT